MLDSRLWRLQTVETVETVDCRDCGDCGDCRLWRLEIENTVPESKHFSSDFFPGEAIL